MGGPEVASKASELIVLEGTYENKASHWGPNYPSLEVTLMNVSRVRHDLALVWLWLWLQFHLRFLLRLPETLRLRRLLTPQKLQLYTIAVAPPKLRGGELLNTRRI